MKNEHIHRLSQTSRRTNRNKNLHARVIDIHTYSNNNKYLSSQIRSYLYTQHQQTDQHIPFPLFLSYAEVLKNINTYNNNSDNVNMFQNNDISDFNSLILEISKLQQTINVQNMFVVIRNLNEISQNS